MIQLENVHKSYGQTVLKGLICRFKIRMMWLSSVLDRGINSLKCVIRLVGRRRAYSHSRTRFITTHGCSIDSLSMEQIAYFPAVLSIAESNC